MRAEVKFAPGSATRLRVLAIPFGGPDYLEGKDFDGEFFSERTDLCPDWYPVQRPLLYHHGLHPDTDVRPVGKVDSTSATVEDGVGVWVEAELDKQAQYYEHIRRLVEREGAYASSGSMPHLVRKAQDGHIDRWPWVELSLTPTPANPLARVEPAQAKAHYKAAGITPPPTLDAGDGGPAAGYLDRLDRLTAEVEDVVDLTHRLTEGRAKVGRPQMTAARRERLLGLIAQVQALLDETEPKAPPPAGAAPEADPAAAEAGPGSTEAGDDAGKAAGHAPPELLAIFEQFQRDESFYGPVSPGRRG